jgi:DNA-binding transcriptional ArsR family regulator
MFRALAHPIRRGIVERLSYGSATVAEATRDFGVSKPTVTRHLKVLEDAGVVVRAIHGRQHHLGLAVDRLDEAATWIEKQRARWIRMFDVVEDYLGERKEKDEPTTRPGGQPADRAHL